MALRSSVAYLLFCFVAVQCRDIRLLHDTRETAQDLPPTGNLIEFLSVEKSSAAEDRNTFKLRFTKNVQDLTLQVFDFASPLPKSGSEGQEEGGISTFTFSTDINDNRDAICIVSTPDKRTNVMFVLNNAKGGATRQDAIQIAEFGILPRGDIVYEPGHDAQFQVYVSQGTERSDQWDHPLSVYFHVLDISSNIFQNIYNFDSLAEATRVELPGGINETTVTVKTSERYITGMMDVTYSSRGGLGDLVSEVVVTKSIILRPSTLSDVFPDGYIGFVRTEQEPCQIGKECSVSCSAVGNSLSSVQVYEIVDGEVQGQITTATEPESPFQYARYVAWDVSTTDPSSAGVSRHFRCVAQDADHSTEASQAVDVLYVFEAEIDEDRSNVVLQANGNMTDAVLTCAVRGYPRPNMTFNLEYEYAHFSGVAPDEILTEGENEFLMRSEVTFNPNEGHGGYFHSPTGALRSASCETFQPSTYAYSSYQLPMEEFAAVKK